ncbi:hypothetical protein [Flexivirga alba]|uniref:DNA-binding protein n=1 Tax=Flexivirga alba TaxID=702742 RepID=A0ABW2AIQ6_9MICO
MILHRGVADRPDGDWWTSGERLAEAVSSLDDPEAADMARTYRSLLDDRHRIVHGLWLGSGEGYVNVLRGKSVKKDPQRPNYDMATATEKAILNVAAAFNQLEARASDAVARHMGLH